MFNIFFQENRSYSLWVTANDGSIPQRTEVYATITDKSGQRPKIPHPPTLPFSSFPNIPLQPKFTRTTQSTTKAIHPAYIDATVPETTTAITTLSPPKTPDDIPEVLNRVENDEKNKSSVHTGDTLTNEVPLTVIPLVAIAGLVGIVAAVILFVCKKNNAQKKEKKKADMVSNIDFIIPDIIEVVNYFSISKIQ